MSSLLLSLLQDQTSPRWCAVPQTFVDHAHQVIDFIKAKGEGADIDLQVWRSHSSAQPFCYTLTVASLRRSPYSQDMFARYTLESISKIAFGTSLGAITSDSLDLATCLRDDNITGSTFGKAFDQAQTAAVWRFLWPFWKLRRMFGTPIERNLSLAVDVVNKYAHDLIKSRREQDLTGKLDVLSWFMNLRDDNGEPYSDEYLRDVIMNFMIAGRDTTANALTWTFHMLTQNPECVTKLREELDSLGIGSPGSAPTAAQLKSMKYTEAVVKETLRLYPSVPRELKLCVKDDTLPDGTSIKAGQVASYMPYCQGRVEKLWGKEAGFPHDAETFYPERWLDEDFKPNAFYYPVFQAGLRTCMGKDMALMEAKTATAMLVASFDIKPVPGHPSNPDIQNSVTCPMEGGLHCVMTPR